MRRLYSLLSVLLTLPAVSAQEPISLEQGGISLFVVIPAVVIFLMLLILLIATFKQNITRVLLRFMSVKRLFSRVKVQPKHEGDHKEEGISHEAFDGYIGRLKDLEKNVPSASSDESFRNFTFITKDFFSKLVGGSHASTDEEIAQNLEKKRKVLVDFSDKISQMKYSGYQPSKEEIAALINEFRKVVSTQIQRHRAEVSPVSKNLIARVVQEDVKIFESIKQYVEMLKREDKKKQIQDMLSSEQRMLKENISKAKRVYDDILRLYCQLSPGERKKVYPRLIKFYDNVNSLIFSSLYSQKSKEELAYFSKELERLREAPGKTSFMQRLVSIPSRLPKVERAPEQRKIPKVEAVKKPSDAFEIKLRIPKFRLSQIKLPTISMPKFKMPEMRRAKAMPEPEKVMPVAPKLKPAPRSLELPELKLPRLPEEVKAPEIKKVKVPELPKLKRPSAFAFLKRRMFAHKDRPKLKLTKPEFRLPRMKLPTISMPKFKLPEMRKAKTVLLKLKERMLAAPKLKLPKLAEKVKAPEIKRVKVPELPKLKRPSTLDLLKRRLFAHKARLELAKPEKPKEEVPEEIVAEAVMPKPPRPVLVKKPSFRFERQPFKFRRPSVEIVPPLVLPKEEQVVTVLRPKKEEEQIEEIKSAIKDKPKLIPKAPKMTDEERKIVDKINDLMTSVSERIEVVDYMGEIRRSLAKAESQLAEGNLSGAEVTYECIKPAFMALSDEDRKLVYPELFSFYKRLKAALDTRKIRLEISVPPNEVLVKEEEKLLEMLGKLESSIS